MKKILHKTFILFFLLFAAEVLVACYKAKEINYRYESLNFEIMDTRNQTERYVANDNDSVAFEDLFLDVHFMSNQVATVLDGPFLSTGAYANSPNEDKYLNKSKLAKIQVIALSAYNNNFSSGAEITSICSFGFGGRTSTTFNQNDFITAFNKNIDDINGQLQPHIPGSMFWVRLNEAPFENSTQKFLIIVELEDGKVMQDETFAVKIL